ncbi:MULTISPECIES: LPS translocon maturation chaperone LptM [Shewanella]|uniref:Lipoprotein n=1 Tax=Shewanella mangrovisoli TaxID=2864211 RepID=A0ABV4VLZ1_9GAMM|nr:MULTISPECIES: lipoprotein [Shewanella]QYJ71828.1 lipoprotein [Shewanella sp. FJAT-51649]QYK09550.1 lipoprotein [Shewanella mangrovisoli]
MLRKMRLFLLLLLGSLFITACGQKGPLYKSSPAEVSQPTKIKAPKSEATPADTAEPQAETEKTQ